MPKYFKSLNDYSIMAWLGANHKGKNYGLPLMGPNNLIPFTEGWRLDTLEKVGTPSRLRRSSRWKTR